VAACEQCGRWFESKDLGRPRRYCTDKCRQAAYRGRGSKGEQMTVTDWDREETDRLLAEARAIPGGRYGTSRSYDTPEDVELDRLIGEVKSGATGAGALGGGFSAAALQHWIKTGEISRTWTAGVESKALIEDTPGRIILPPDIAIGVLAVARQQGMLRDLVTVYPTTAQRQPVGLLSTAATGWGPLETGTTVTDAAVVPAASTGGDIVVADLTSLVKIGQDELQDTPAMTEQALNYVFGDAIAEAVDLAISAGTGSGQPSGLTLAANITRIPAGQKTTAASPPTIANLRALPWLLPARYRPRATWLFSTDAASAVAGLTDTAGGAIWPNPGNPDPKTGGGFMGWPAYTVPGLPAMTGTNAPSILFGDLKSAYRLVERLPIRVTRLEQRFAETGDVGLLLTYRAGGDLVRENAMAAYLL
jgi:HK97 family phage major capsid protein